MRFTLALLFMARILPAQFHGLAPTADGTTLYFSTTYAQKNTSQPASEKVFVLDNQGLRPYAVASTPDTFTSYDTPSVSSDGKIVADIAHNVCPFRPIQCFDFSMGLTEIRGLDNR